MKEVKDEERINPPENMPSLVQVDQRGKQRQTEQKQWQQVRVGKAHPCNGMCEQGLPAAWRPMKENPTWRGGAQVVVHLRVTHVDEHLADFLAGNKQESSLSQHKREGIRVEGNLYSLTQQTDI